MAIIYLCHVNLARVVLLSNRHTMASAYLLISWFWFTVDCLVNRWQQRSEGCKGESNKGPEAGIEYYR